MHNVHIVNLTFSPTCFHLVDYTKAKAAVSGDGSDKRSGHLHLLAIGDD